MVLKKALLRSWLKPVGVAQFRFPASEANPGTDGQRQSALKTPQARLKPTIGP
jgi:hypothetical protein